MNRYLPKLGMRGRLIFIFAVVGTMLLFTGYRIWKMIGELEIAHSDRQKVEALLNVLKDAEKGLSNLNLLGMDIIVDHYEDPEAKVIRVDEFNELKKKIAEESEIRINAMEAVKIKEGASELNQSEQVLIAGVSGLIDAIDSGEKRPEKYAEFDEQIDRSKHAGNLAVEKYRSIAQTRLNETGDLTSELFSRLLSTSIIMFALCVTVFTVIGVPVIISLTRTAHKIRLRLSSIAEGVQQTSDEISSSSQHLAEASCETAAAIQESVSSMAEMTAMLSQTVTNIGDTAELSRDVLDQAHEGVEIMGEMARSMKAISQSSTHLKEIIRVIDNITSKTNIINDVVFKTQLLAVNASIEAARAAHHGKGFAVVANEVASLATLSGKASSEIKELLVNSANRVREIVDETGAAIFAGGQASNRSMEAFERISKSVVQISDKIDQISSASKEQELGVSQTTAALNQMNQATYSTSSLAASNAQLGTKILAHSNDLKRINRGMHYLVAGTDQVEPRRAPLRSTLSRILGEQEGEPIVSTKDKGSSSEARILKVDPNREGTSPGSDEDLSAAEAKSQYRRTA